LEDCLLYCFFDRYVLQKNLYILLKTRLPPQKMSLIGTFWKMVICHESTFSVIKCVAFALQISYYIYYI